MATYTHDTPTLHSPIHLTEHAFKAVLADYQGEHTTASVLYAENEMDGTALQAIKYGIDSLYLRHGGGIPLQRFVSEKMTLDLLNDQLELGDCLENYWAQDKGYLKIVLCKETEKSLIYYHWVFATFDGQTVNVDMFEERRRKSAANKPSGLVNKVRINRRAFIEVRGSRQESSSYLTKREALDLFCRAKCTRNNEGWVDAVIFAFSGSRAQQDELYLQDCVDAIEQLPWWTANTKSSRPPKVIGKTTSDLIHGNGNVQIQQEYLVSSRKGSLFSVVSWPCLSRREDVVIVAGAKQMPEPCDIVMMSVCNGKGVII